MTDFPTPDTELTHILVVEDLERTRRWYTDVLGATVYREYGGTSSVLSFNRAWLLLVTGGRPTPDKPGVTLAPAGDPERVDHLFTIRVDDCQATYEDPGITDVERDFARLWNPMPKVVFSTSLERMDASARLVRGDVREILAKVRRDLDGDLDVSGPNLAGQFVRAGLVDDTSSSSRGR